MWYRENVCHHNPEGSTWSLISTPGEVAQISCGSYDLLWATLWEGQAIVREGIDRNNPQGILYLPGNSSDFCSVKQENNIQWLLCFVSCRNFLEHCGVPKLWQWDHARICGRWCGMVHHKGSKSKSLMLWFCFYTSFLYLLFWNEQVTFKWNIGDLVSLYLQFREFYSLSSWGCSLVCDIHSWVQLENLISWYWIFLRKKSMFDVKH